MAFRLSNVVAVTNAQQAPHPPWSTDLRETLPAADQLTSSPTVDLVGLIIEGSLGTYGVELAG